MKNRSGFVYLKAGRTSMDWKIAAAFLRDILAHPEDDVPRLIYADWLNEHGLEERAELIRVQCELAALGPQSWRPDSASYMTVLWQREARLLSGTDAYGPGSPQSQPRSEWVPSLRNVLPWDRGGWTWRRGFVEALTCTCQEWLEHGPQWVREYPLTGVKLLGREPVQQLPHCWSWSRHSTSLEEEHFVPDCLAFAMQPMLHEVIYLTEDGAHETLSRACLKWAKQERNGAAFPK